MWRSWFLLPPSLDLLLKRWKFSSGSDLAIPTDCHDLHPSCSSPCPPGMKEMFIKYPWLWMLQHWLCLVSESGTAAWSSLSGSPRQHFYTRKVLLLSSAGATQFLEDLLSLSRLNLSQGRGHQSKRPPWAHAWKQTELGGELGWAGCFQSKLRAWAAYWIQVPTGYSCSSVRLGNDRVRQACASNKFFHSVFMGLCVYLVGFSNSEEEIFAQWSVHLAAPDQVQLLYLNTLYFGFSILSF